MSIETASLALGALLCCTMLWFVIETLRALEFRHGSWLWPFSRKHWPRPSTEQSQHRRNAQIKDAIVTTLVMIFLVCWSRRLEHVEMVAATTSQLVLVFGLAALMMVVPASDIVYGPAVSKDDVAWHIVGPIGHTAFFTCQTQFLQAVYFLLHAVAVATQDGQLMAVVYRLSLWVNTQGVALCLLFLQLNWFEKKWQRDILVPMERRNPGFGHLMLFTHIPPLPVALFDMIFLRPSGLLELHGTPVSIIVGVAFTYGTVYLCWTKLMQHVLMPGTLIYPFIGDIDSPLKGVGFVAVLGTAVSLMAAGVNALGVSY